MSTKLTRREVAQILRGRESLLVSLSRMGLSTSAIGRLRRVHERSVEMPSQNPRRRMPLTLPELLDRTEEEMLMMTFFGRGTLRPLKELLSAYGLELNWAGVKAGRIEAYIAEHDPQQIDPAEACPDGGTHDWEEKGACLQCVRCEEILE